MGWFKDTFGSKDVDVYGAQIDHVYPLDKAGNFYKNVKREATVRFSRMPDARSKFIFHSKRLYKGNLSVKGLTKLGFTPNDNFPVRQVNPVAVNTWVVDNYDPASTSAGIVGSFVSLDSMVLWNFQADTRWDSDLRTLTLLGSGNTFKILKKSSTSIDTLPITVTVTMYHIPDEWLEDALIAQYAYDPVGGTLEFTGDTYNVIAIATLPLNTTLFPGGYGYEITIENPTTLAVSSFLVESEPMLPYIRNGDQMSPTSGLASIAYHVPTTGKYKIALLPVTELEQFYTLTTNTDIMPIIPVAKDDQIIDRPTTEKVLEMVGFQGKAFADSVKTALSDNLDSLAIFFCVPLIPTTNYREARVAELAFKTIEHYVGSSDQNISGTASRSGFSLSFEAKVYYSVVSTTVTQSGKYFISSTGSTANVYHQISAGVAAKYSITKNREHSVDPALTHVSYRGETAYAPDLAIPVPRVVFRSLSFKTYNICYNYCLWQYGFAHEVVRVEWYQREVFQVIVQIIGVILFVVGVITAAEGGFLLAYAGLFLLGLGVAYVINWAIDKYDIGDNWALALRILGAVIIVSVAAMTGMMDTQGLLLMSGSQLMEVIQANIGDRIKTVMAEMALENERFDEAMDLIAEKLETLEEFNEDGYTLFDVAHPGVESGLQYVNNFFYTSSGDAMYDLDFLYNIDNAIDNRKSIT